MKRIALALLILSVAVPCLVCPRVSLAGAEYAGGSGTVDDPYQIASAADLLTLAADTGNYDKFFILTADINLGDYTFTTAVISPDIDNSSGGYDGIDFTGEFNGNGHIISNLTINTGGIPNDYLGLFGSLLGGSIKNLRLENVAITGGDDSECLAPLAGLNDGNIVNCFSNGSVTGGTGSFCLGGLVGYNDHGSISNSCSSVNINSGSNSNWLSALVGLNNLGVIVNCSSTGTVTGGDDSWYLGGLVGGNWSGTIGSCHSTAAITGADASIFVGGLIGDNWNSSVSDCFSTGSVVSGDDSNFVGGLAGDNDGGSIGNCYSVGIVTAGDGSANLGGLVGDNYDDGIINSSYFLDTAGPDNGHGVPLTDTQMKQQASFVGWDFVNIWHISEGVDYPKLKAFVKYSGGSGTADDPYQIANASDLLELANDTDDYNKYFILTADIDLDPNLPGNQVFSTAVIAPDTNNTNWSFDGSDFTGVFDGAGHKIVNLTIDTNGAANDYLAFFGSVSGGEVRNLGLENVSITAVLGGSSSHYIAALAAQSSYCDINNCYSTGSIKGGAWIGGLIGENGYGTISNCFSTCAVTGGDGSFGFGGLVADNAYGTIENCHYKGTVAAGNNSSELGGLVGHNSITPFSNDGIIINCYSTGVVTGGDGAMRLGGLVGLNKGKISGCFSTADVNGGNTSTNLGGLAGITDVCGISDSYSTGRVTGTGNLGGLAGMVYSGYVSNSYSTGSVSGVSNLGGLVGNVNFNGTVSNCCFLNTAGPNNGYGTPLTDVQMKQQASFVGWDFVNVWHICESTNYPKFIRQMTPGDITCPDGVNTFDLMVLCDQWFIPPTLTFDLYPAGGDGIVNFADFAVFAEQWPLNPDINVLDAFADEWLGGIKRADLWPAPNGDGIVNFQDFTILANHWLEGL